MTSDYKRPPPPPAEASDHTPWPSRGDARKPAPSPGDDGTHRADSGDVPVFDDEASAARQATSVPQGGPAQQSSPWGPAGAATRQQSATTPSPAAQSTETVRQPAARGIYGAKPSARPAPATATNPIPQSGAIMRAATYDGQFKAVMMMSLRHLLFNLITLGFFRFWGRTEMRRYFWSHIRLLGSRLEYVGRGRQLFRGFVLVLVCVSILLVGIAMINVLLVVDPEVSAAIGTILLVFSYLILRNLARFWAWRFRLQQTRWRGIQPVVKGSAFKYLMISLWGTLLSAMSFYLLYPYARIAPQRYLLNSIHIGDRPLQCEAETGPLIGKWAIAMLLIGGGTMFIAFGISILLALAFSISLSGTSADPVVFGIIGGAIVFGIAASATVFYMRYRVQEVQYLTYCTSWGRLRFQSEIRTRRVVAIQGLFYFLVLLILGAGAVTGSYFVSQGQNPIDLLGRLGSLPLEQLLLVIGGLIVAFTLYSMVKMFRVTVLNHLLISEFLNTFTVWNIDDLEEVEQDKDQLVRGGEGLAGFFDIDGGF